ncbi:MAG: response regulator transcription factor [Anaerolineales bacterium]
MIRILIVEDDWNAREGLKERFADESDFEVVGTAQTEEEALELLENHQPDVVVLDIRLHGEESGPKIADEIQMRSWPTRILVYSAHDAPEMVDTMLNKGAMGYYVKDGRNTVKDMLTAVRTVARGERWFGNGLEAWMASKLRAKEEDDEDEEVTPYQMDILQMVAEGKTNKEIALAFDVDPRTVESHIYRICKKIGANNRTHAVVMAMEKGWIKLKKG